MTWPVLFEPDLPQLLGAACHGHPEPLWDERARHGESRAAAIERWVRAVAICRHCPVVSECLAARRPHDGGVWGGHVFTSGSDTTLTEPVEPCTTCRVATVPRHYWDTHPAVRVRCRPRTGGLCQACYDRTKRDRRSQRAREGARV